MEQIHLGGGCFWCIEGGLIGLRGVHAVVQATAVDMSTIPPTSKFVGRRPATPRWSGYLRPEVIPRMTLLRVFHTLFDPTQLNRQGNDVGPQYRSIVLYSSEEQKGDALAAIEEVSTYYDDPVVTEVVPLEVFWEAESSHHDSFARTGTSNPYCVAVVAPKIAKARARHGDLYE